MPFPSFPEGKARTQWKYFIKEDLLKSLVQYSNAMNAEIQRKIIPNFVLNNALRSLPSIYLAKPYLLGHCELTAVCQTVLQML